MKRLLYIPFLLILLSCKKDSGDMAPASALASIEGTWQLKEIEKGVIGDKFWEAVPAIQKEELIFRYDGVILQKDGKPRCCNPNSFIINGQLREIKPMELLPANPACALVNCAYCPSWELQFSGNELIVSACNTQRMKYVK